MSTTTTPNMNLAVPVVGQESGPQYATDINNCMSSIDQHDHTPGNGVLITPNGLNISSDLSFGSNNATNLNSARFTALASPLTAVSPNLDCVYVSGVDLYYNDGSGNIVRITQSGGIAGSPGSISNLTSPASASYVSGTSTFVWQSAANTPANMDNASVILRNLVANSKGLTLSPPNAMGSDFTIVLPSLPVSTSLLSIDSSGNIGTTMTAALANSVGVAMTSTGSNAIGVSMTSTGANAVANSRTRPANTSTVAVGGVALSGGSGSFTSSSLSFVNVTNQSVTITTSGRPVAITFISANNGVQGSVGGNASTTGIQVFFQITSSNGGGWIHEVSVTTANVSPSITVPAGSLSIVDSDVSGLPGTYTYVLQARVQSGASGQVVANNLQMMAYEL